MPFGRFQRSNGAQPMSDINMTPLIDVMLVLLVIFMLTAPLLASSLRLNLPRVEAAGPAGDHRSVQLAMDRTGVVYLNDQALPLTELAQRLQQIGQNEPQTEIQLRADQAVPYGQVVQLMALAQKAGLSRIGFIAQP